MDPRDPPDRSELNLLSDEEAERLALLEVASTALLAHAESLGETEPGAEARHAA